MPRLWAGATSEMYSGTWQMSAPRPMPSSRRKTIIMAMFCEPAVMPAQMAVTRKPQRMVFLRPSQSPTQPWRMDPKAQPKAKRPLTAPMMLAVYAEEAGMR